MAVNINRLANTLIGTSADAVYTVPASTVTRIDAMALTNTDTNAQTASIWLVASGGGANAQTIVMSAQQIGPGQTVIVKGALGQVLKQGGTIQAQASVANRINIYASGVEIT